MNTAPEPYPEEAYEDNFYASLILESKDSFGASLKRKKKLFNHSSLLYLTVSNKGAK